MLYSSSHACLFLPWIFLVLVCSHELVTCVYESKILMYYRSLLGYMLRPSQHFHLVEMTCSLKALVYRIHLRLMLWGASCYTKILSPSCDKTLSIPTCPKSQHLEWKLIPFCQYFTKMLGTAPSPLSKSSTLLAPPIPCYPQAVPPLMALSP